MGDRTGIEWCDATWNPLVGCSAISEACTNCWAVRMAVRLAQNPTISKADRGRYWSTIRHDGYEWFGWSGEIAIFPDRLDQPRHWRKPRRIFVGSMTDLLHQNMPPGALVDVLRVCECCPQHTFMLLTKRPENILKGLSAHWVAALKNVWWGVTVENQAHEDRIVHLLRIQAAMRFVSLEPLLGPVDLRGAGAIDWVIVGCETGPHRRHTRIEWIRDVVAQCRDAGVPCFAKAIEVPRVSNTALEAVLTGIPLTSFGWEQLILDHGGRVSKDMSEWPADLRVRERPKGASDA